MNEKFLNLPQSWDAIYIFLRSLWDQNPKKFSCHGIGLGAYLYFANCLFKEDYDWRRVYTTIFHQAVVDEKLLHSDAILKIGQALLTKYRQKYGFDLGPVETLFLEMQNDPKHSGWELWDKALTDASQGKTREWLREYRYSDWRDK